MAAEGGRMGYAAGSIVKGGAKIGKKFLDFIKTGKYIDKHGTKVNVPKVVKRLKKQGSPHLETYEESMKAEGGRIGFKKGTDKRWMQKVSASIKKRGTKGKCTPITKPGCTGRAKALAKTFKKIAAKNKKA